MKKDRYYRLYVGSRIIGFKRILTSGEVEYLALTGVRWSQKRLFCDSAILLSTSPVSIATLGCEGS